MRMAFMRYRERRHGKRRSHDDRGENVQEPALPGHAEG
jgi:hypothetical protein